MTKDGGYIRLTLAKVGILTVIQNEKTVRVEDVVYV